MSPRGVRRWRVVSLAGVALGVLLLVAPPSATVEDTEHMPDVPPHLLAHMLADFSHQPHVGAWRVVEDSGNYTSWRYVVQYECGARCEGEARVHASDEHEHAPAHGTAASAHTVRLEQQRCTRAPLIQRLALCDAVQVKWRVWRQGGGCAVRTRAAARCSLAALWGGGCAPRLRAYLDALMSRVRTALHADTRTH